MNRPVRILFFVLTMSIVAFAQPPQTPQQPGGGHKPTQSEIRSLLKNASTPEDHLKLAAYMRDEAQQEEATAAFHKEMAEMYEMNPSPYQGHNFSSTEMKRHCDDLSKSAHKAAIKLAKMADYEEWFARQMRDHPYRRGFRR